MGCDVCYTNHAEADQDDMDSLMTLLAVAGTNFLIAVPGADDIMLNYQSLSFHDLLGLRHQLNLQPAPEFGAWLSRMALLDEHGRLAPPSRSNALVRGLLTNG
jgi:ethanolamine ammonia-lyase large subunit